VELTGRALSRRSLLKASALGALASTLPLSACGSSSAGRTTITLHETKPEVVPYFDKLVATYNHQQSDIQVVHDSTTSLIAGFVRGHPPDLELDNYNLTTSIFISKGVLADLADFPEAKTIDPKVQGLVNQYATYKGQTSVLPYSIAGAGVIYNVDLFEQHGVAVPMTWSQLLAACETFKSKGVDPIYGTFKDPWTLQQGLFDYVSGGVIDVASFFHELKTEGTHVGRDSRASFEETFKPALDQMIQLLPFHNADAASRGYADGNVAFANGKGAMYLQGPWAIGQIALANPKLKLGTFALPATDNAADTKARVNLDLAFWIPTSSGKKDAAHKLLSYLMTPDILNKYNNDNLAFSPVLGAPDETDDRIAGLQPYIRAGKFYQGAGTYLPGVIPFQNYLQEAVLTRSVNPMLNKLDKDWSRLAKRSV
jgi:raffinose/stachyose/melibiose transport system substrate-binding protein